MLHPGNFYHIYNHANGDENLFRQERNYAFFLRKVKKYLLPYMNIYAYCLMPNHFHLLVKIKEEAELVASIQQIRRSDKLSEMQEMEKVYATISKSFSNLFSSYTQAYNKIFMRKGSLFKPNFKSRLIESDIAFCTVVCYIHSNPVHHGFTENIRDWKYSSLQSLLSNGPTQLKRDYVLAIFGGKKPFELFHQLPIHREYFGH